MWGLLGVLLSAAWLAVAWFWFDREIGLDNYSYVLLPEVAGQFVAGLLAPLILIWVLVAALRPTRGLRALREEIADLRGELAERARLEAARPRGEPALRRPLEPVAPPAASLATPAVAEPAHPPPRVAPAVAPAPAAPQPLVPPPAAPAAPSGGEGSASVTSLAQEVARNLGRLATEPSLPPPALALAPAPLDAEAALDEEFRQLVHKVGRDLNAICMDLSAVLCRKPARDEALKAYNRGQKDAFHALVRDYLARHEPVEIMGRLSQADAQSLLHTYAMKFASLIDEAARRDPSGAQEQALRRGTMGQLYEEAQRHTQVARGGGRA